MRTVCGQVCGIFGGFSQLSGQSCTSAVCPRSFLCAWCQKLHCRGLVVLMMDGSVMVVFFFCDVFRIFCFFFRGGSNVVAFRAKVNGTWQAKFQRRLRYRVAIPIFSSFFPLFSPFPLLPSLFFTFFHIFPIICLHLLRFSAFSDVFSSKRRVSL